MYCNTCMKLDNVNKISLVSEGYLKSLEVCIITQEVTSRTEVSSCDCNDCKSHRMSPSHMKSLNS